MIRDRKEKYIIKDIFLKNNYINLGLSIVFIFCFCNLNIITAFLFKSLVDTAISGTLANLKRLIAWSLVYLVFYFFVANIKTFFISKYVSRAMVQYKNFLFNKIVHKNLNVFNKEVTGKYISILTNDIVSIESNYVLGMLNIVTQFLLLVIALGVMVFLNWFLTCCVLTAAIIPFLGSVFLGNKLSAVELNISNNNTVFVSGINDIFKGFSVIKSFQAENQVISIISNKNKKLEEAKKKRRLTANMVNVVSFSSSFFVTVVVCGIGAYLSISQMETLGTVIAFAQLLDYVVGPIQELGTLLANRKATVKLIEEHQEIVNDNVSVWKGTIRKRSFNTELTFSDVSFGYGEEEVLKGINLRIKKGGSYAIVGNSGSGKTTLLNLLQGCHDGYKGTIHIDDVELRKIAVESFYDLMTIIHQNVFLFDDSIYQNVTMYKSFSDEKIDDVIKKAGLDELVKKRGKLYSCGENGKNLSGGEKQKISIARALLNDTPILLVDEATAALDNISERNIMETIIQLKDLTRIVVTHSLKADFLEKFDCIIVIKDGKISDVGKYHDLYDKKGYFFSLVNVSEK